MIRARYGVIHIPSPEEGRVLDVLETMAKMSGAHIGSVYRWSITEGLVRNGKSAKPDEATQNPESALTKMLGWQDDGSVFVIRDMHHYFESAQIVRLLRDLAHQFRGRHNTAILLSPSLKVPPDVEKEIAVADFPLPTHGEIKSLVDRSYRDFKQNPGPFADEFDDDLRHDVIRACSGLTEDEIDDALAKAVIEAGGLNEAVVDSLNRTKREAIRKTQCLEAIETDESMASVGGLDVLKTWIRKRQRTFSDEARAFGIEYPKGVLTLGVPGGGKGLSAKAVSHQWRLPLLRLDMGSVFGGLVGESEDNLRSALRIAEAVAPVVLWIDEIEKGLSGIGSSNVSDGGTAARVFGTFLTWLQEKEAPVFCYFTANDISQLPPELLRKGRVDEIFFIDLPNEQERAEILDIHLRKRDQPVERFNVEMLARECEGFVGAEIEQGIKEALIDAFDQRQTDPARELQNQDIVRAFDRTVPMVKTQRNKIARLLQFVEEGRAVRASSGQRVELNEDFFGAGLDLEQLRGEVT